jgi:hypothetical protein
MIAVYSKKAKISIRNIYNFISQDNVKVAINQTEKITTKYKDNKK